jgi:Coenzyme PQQ synthesis protein D (PqqD)
MSDPTDTPPLDDESRLEPVDAVVWRRVENAVVLVHLDTNKTYELNRTGGRLWELLQGGATYGEAVERLASEFDVTHEQVRAEGRDLVAQLLAEELVSPPRPA